MHCTHNVKFSYLIRFLYFLQTQPFVPTNSGILDWRMVWGWTRNFVLAIHLEFPLPDGSNSIGTSPSLSERGNRSTFQRYINFEFHRVRHSGKYGSLNNFINWSSCELQVKKMYLNLICHETSKDRPTFFTAP
jgi:hypothetical protein